MKRLLLALGVLAISAPLWAQVSKTFTWVNPTQYVNGTSLPPSQIRETRISVSPTSGGTPMFVEVVPGAATSHASLPIFAAGQWFAVARTVDLAGATSDPSNEAVFTVGPCEANPAGCRPLPPTGLTVQ
jgi:hypothetical protein